MSVDRSVEAEELYARAAREHPRDRLERIAADLATPASERLSDRTRAQTFHLLNALFDDVEDLLRRSLAISLAAIGPAGRAAATDLGQSATGLIWPRVERAITAPPFDLLDAALTRANEHSLVSALRLSAPAIDSLTRLVANNPDPELWQRMMNLVVADSRRLDSFGEPRLPFDMIEEVQAIHVGWLAGAALRAHILSQHPVDEGLLDSAIEQAVRHLLAERAESSAMRHAVRLAARLDALESLDSDLLSGMAREGHILLLAAALARLGKFDPAAALKLLVSADESAWLVLLRALDLPYGAMKAIAKALAVNRDDPTPIKARVKQAQTISLADARRLLTQWQRDARYAAAIAALM